MRRLEKDSVEVAKHGYLTKDLIVRVAAWGRLRNIKRVQCPERFSILLYDSDYLVKSPRIDPSMPLKLLRETINGMGPTYLSKVLMFSCPQLYGAIDTRLVRVFGRGDSSLERLRWLSLIVKNDDYGWYIPENQTFWPGDYHTWIKILHYITRSCHASGLQCPHPDAYLAEGLRERGNWIAADVETALFSFASKRVKAL